MPARKPGRSLKFNKEAYVCGVGIGLSRTQLCKLEGVSQKTVEYYLRKDGNFKKEVQEAEEKYRDLYYDRKSLGKNLPEIIKRVKDGDLEAYLELLIRQPLEILRKPEYDFWLLSIPAPNGFLCTDFLELFDTAARDNSQLVLLHKARKEWIKRKKEIDKWFKKWSTPMERQLFLYLFVEEGILSPMSPPTRSELAAFIEKVEKLANEWKEFERTGQMPYPFRKQHSFPLKFGEHSLTQYKK